MKSCILTLFVGILLSALTASSQTPVISAFVSGDTVTLSETGAYRNCGALYTMEIDLVDYHIDWYQVDTGEAALCLCTFDLSVTYAPLEPGSYTVNVYFNESYSPMDTIFEGTTGFIIEEENPGMRSGIISQYQSDCYVGVSDPETDNNDFRIYPVPIANGGLLYIEAFPEGGLATLEIFTLTGNSVYSKQYDGNQPIQDQLRVDEIFPVSGIYLARFRSDDQVYIRKITVL